MFIRVKSSRWLDNLIVCHSKEFRDVVINDEFKIVGLEGYSDTEFTGKVNSSHYNRSIKTYTVNCIYDYSASFHIFSNDDIDNAKSIRDTQREKYDFRFEKRMIIKIPKTINVIYDNFDTLDRRLVLQLRNILSGYTDCDISVEIIRLLLEMFRADINNYKEHFVFTEKRRDYERRQLMYL